ncbi:carbon-nitrogen family hydrolase [Terrilactibacillus laevilacticus]|uniref:carbon-nitrogen family hydrolase n=1 Tax=Terrilactibacillus laevilacticus TaxID=1380157 RepID=UPI0011477DF6|nr:carbon-nitrogen family hydrolase [Terrilactibacillus laevilacticus]
MKYAIFQMDIVPGEIEKNHKKVIEWMEETVPKEQPDIVMLPEMWTTAYTLQELDKIADVDGEPTIPFLKELSKKYHVHIVGGSIANKKSGKIYNTAVVVNKDGELIYLYDKIHLVPMLDEPLYLEGGQNKIETFTLDGVKMGIIICYDLRFPELARELALSGIEVLHVVGEWPTPRIDHWKTLQLARAIENQTYVISSNRVGFYDDTLFGGHSLVIDPWGHIIQEGSSDKEETIIANIDIDMVSEVRSKVPVFSNRRPKLYR